MFLVILIALTVVVSGHDGPHIGDLREILSNRTGKITGGSDADIANYPYMAALTIKTSALKYVPFCGGAFLDSETILTAAHCLEDVDASDIYVVTGVSDVSKIIGRQVKQAASIEIHRRYRKTSLSLDWDIAIIKLTSPMASFTPIGIVQEGSDDDAEGTSCTLAGWGSVGDEEDAEQLQVGQFTVGSDRECRQFWRRYNWQARGRFRLFWVKSRQICAQDTTAAPCFGDSGGPLVCNGKVAGLDSIGNPNCSPEIPEVFTRVSALNDWINARLTSTSTTTITPD